MNVIRFFIVFFMLLQAAYAEVEIINWRDSSSGNYSQIRSDAEIDIYVTSWCPYCRKAVAYLESQGIPYNKYDIEKDDEAAARKSLLAPGYSGIPLAVINGQIIKGYSRESYEEALQ